MKEKEDEIEMRGCWIKFRFSGRCVSSRSQVETSISGTNTPYAESRSTNDTSLDHPVNPTASSATTSNGESTPSTPKLTEELNISSHLRKFNFNELKSATRNFRPESLLGEGGFGCVFKGWINENGTTPVKPGTGLSVAVKTLNHDGLQGHKEWLAEVNFLGDLLHPNLVKLIGYCIEDDQRLLVYEFMPRGSLENHLFRRSLPLPWATRMKIALGAAKGLAFLHEEAERLEGRFSVRGAQKSAQLATLCLNRDPKARPLMSEVYEVLKPLVNLNDMACSSPYFQALHLQGERTGTNQSSRNGVGLRGPSMRSLSVSRCPPNLSPQPNDQPYRSPRPVR